MIVVSDNSTSKTVVMTIIDRTIVKYAEMSDKLQLSGVTFTATTAGEISDAAVTRKPIRIGPETAAEAIANRKLRDSQRQQ